MPFARFIVEVFDYKRGYSPTHVVRILLHCPLSVYKTDSDGDSRERNGASVDFLIIFIDQNGLKANCGYFPVVETKPLNNVTLGFGANKGY